MPTSPKRYPKTVNVDESLHSLPNHDLLPIDNNCQLSVFQPTLFCHCKTCFALDVILNPISSDRCKGVNKVFSMYLFHVPVSGGIVFWPFSDRIKLNNSDLVGRSRWLSLAGRKSTQEINRREISRRDRDSEAGRAHTDIS